MPGPARGHRRLGQAFKGKINWIQLDQGADDHDRLISRLYAGTFDWSYLAGLSAAQYVPLPVPLLGVNYGADLFRFDSTKKAAKPVSVHGVGNYLNYGIRNMLAATNGKLYLGSANPMNLETGPSMHFATRAQEPPGERGVILHRHRPTAAPRHLHNLRAMR